MSYNVISYPLQHTHILTSHPDPHPLQPPTLQPVQTFQPESHRLHRPHRHELHRHRAPDGRAASSNRTSYKWSQCRCWRSPRRVRCMRPNLDCCTKLLFYGLLVPCVILHWPFSFSLSAASILYARYIILNHDRLKLAWRWRLALSGWLASSIILPCRAACPPCITSYSPPHIDLNNVS
jgi:hypothetical protein